MEVVALTDQQRELLRDRGRTGRARRSRALNVTLEIDAKLSPEQVGRAVQRSVDAHPALRGGFEAGGQRIQPAAPVELATEQSPSTEDARDQAFTRAEEFCRAGFAPDELPRLRALLLWLGGDAGRSVLVLAIDPVVCDAWSANLLADELRSALAAQLAGGTPEPVAADPYLEVWQERVARSRAEADRAEAAARQRLAGYSATWGGPDQPAADEPAATQALRDLPDGAAGALQERCRELRTSALAPALLALQLLQTDPLLPRAVVATLVGRETDAEWAAFGHLATDVWLPVRLRGLTLAEAVRSVRDGVFETLTELPVPWRRVADALAEPTGAGTVSVLYLPAELSGGSGATSQPRPAGEERVRRAAVSICPTGADVDLCLVEHPPVDDRGRTPALRLVGELHRPETGIDLVALLDAWAALLGRMAGAGSWHEVAWPTLLDPSQLVSR